MILNNLDPTQAFVSERQNERFTQLKDVPDIAIGEIAGRDSVAAIIQAAKDHGFKTIVPTVVYTGTEYGSRQTVYDNVSWLQQHLESSVAVEELVFVGDPSLWSALNGRYSGIINKRFGMFSPCLACHLYMHLCRIPLSVRLGHVPVISGERNTHNGRLKLSQTPQALDAFLKIFKHARIPFLLPLRDFENDDGIKRIVGTGWQQGQKQLSCVFNGNYYDLDGHVIYDETAYQRYIEEFLIPCGIAVIDAWKNADYDDLNIDYAALVQGIL